MNRSGFCGFAHYPRPAQKVSCLPKNPCVKLFGQMTNQDERYVYWAAKCKECGATVFLECIAKETEKLKGRKYVLMEFDPFKETCKKCGVEHEYDRKDIFQVSYFAPQADYVASRGFVKAHHTSSSPHQEE